MINLPLEHTNKPNEMSDGLLRQRRNLILVCVFLWFLKFGGVSISKISLAGFEISINNVNALFVSIWIAFAYFLVRYYQYFSGEGVSKLHNTFHDLREQHCAPIINRIIERANYQDRVNTHSSYSTLKKHNWIYHGQVLIQNNALENFQHPISKWKLYPGVTLAIINTCFRNHVVTDYLLPFFLADWVLYYCGKDNWDGSFIRGVLSGFTM